MQAKNRPKILFVAEAVTLAHFARILTLANMLDSSEYEVVIASDPRFIQLEAPLNCQFIPVYSIPSAQFAQALAQGKPLYDAKTLAGYVEEDLSLLDNIKPDLVIGDFRLSLAVSAPLRKIPYANIVNAYWSPYADTVYPVPDIPLTRMLGVKIGQKLFDLVRPFAFALHARPINHVRRQYGQPSSGTDLRNVYSWGNYTLYPDIPELVPTSNLPANHRYIGPVLWSTKSSLPEWWDNLPQDKPIIFLTLGSSGRTDSLPMVLEALSQLPVTVIATTSGKLAEKKFLANVYLADFLPVDLATQRSQLVISNGGSLTAYQALTSGVPMIGLCEHGSIAEYAGR